MGIVISFEKVYDFYFNNEQNTNKTRFAKHHSFFFWLYDVIDQHHSGLGYHLLTKICF